MDLNSIGKTLATTRYDMHVLGPTGEKLYATTDPDGKPTLTFEETDRPMIWTLVGVDSKEFRRGQSAVFSWSKKNAKNAKYNEARMKQHETVAACLVGWQNTIWNGEDLAFTLDNVMEVLEGYAPGFEQANEAIADRGNFFKGA